MVDFIASIKRRRERKSRYILTLADYAAWYPGKIALLSTGIELVAEALLKMFSRVRAPEESYTSGIHGDEGGQETAFDQASDNDAVPYYGKWSRGEVQYTGTLKSMLKMCLDQPEVWDTYLSAFLSAFREAPQIL